MKPTPAQAVLLRMLSARGAYALFVKDRRRRMLRVKGYSLLVSDGKRPSRVLNPSTFRVVRERGWVEQGGSRWRLSAAGRLALEGLVDADFISPAPLRTSTEIIAILRDRHPAPEWAFLAEMRQGTGYGGTSEGRMDAWAMHTWPSRRFERIAYEVKISRTDFLREIKQPEKRAFALTVSNRYYFVVPEGLARPDELPDECGLLEITAADTVRLAKDCPWHDTPPPSWRFVAALARRIQAAAVEEDQPVSGEIN